MIAATVPPAIIFTSAVSPTLPVTGISTIG